MNPPWWPTTKTLAGKIAVVQQLLDAGLVDKKHIKGFDWGDRMTAPPRIDKERLERIKIHAASAIKQQPFGGDKDDPVTYFDQLTNEIECSWAEVVRLRGLIATANNDFCCIPACRWCDGDHGSTNADWERIVHAADCPAFTPTGEVK